MPTSGGLAFTQKCRCACYGTESSRIRCYAPVTGRPATQHAGIRPPHLSCTLDRRRSPVGAPPKWSWVRQWAPRSQVGCPRIIPERGESRSYRGDQARSSWCFYPTDSHESGVCRRWGGVTGGLEQTVATTSCSPSVGTPSVVPPRSGCPIGPWIAAGVRALRWPRRRR